jgi:hypothetical protein
MILEGQSHSLSQEWIKLILGCHLPQTLHQLQAFWGVTRFYCIWILGYVISQALILAFKKAQQNSQSYLEWNLREPKGFPNSQTGTLQAWACLFKTFQLYVYEKRGLALGVLTQLRGATPKPIGYLSKETGNVAKGWPGWLRALAAVCLLISDAQNPILGWPLTIFTPHDLGGLLTSKGGLWLSDNRLVKYQAQLLECPDISLWMCSALNPAFLLHTEKSPITHSCEEVLAE